MKKGLMGVLFLILFFFPSVLWAGEKIEQKTIQVKFWVDEVLVAPGSTIYSGQWIKVEAAMPINGYGYMISAGPSGRVYQLWPSTVSPVNTVKTGDKMVLGPFPIVPPCGTERILIFFSDYPLDVRAILATIGLEKKVEEVKKTVQYRSVEIAPQSQGLLMERGDIREKSLEFNIQPGYLNVALFELTSSER